MAVQGVPFEVVLAGQPTGLAPILTVEIYNPVSGAAILAASGTGISEPRPGTYRVSKTVNTAGSYRVRWVRTDTSTTLSDEPLSVTSGYPAAPPGPNLVLSVDELRLALGIDPDDHSRDELFEQMIAYASRAIASYTERDFGAPLVTESRTYEYDGSGYLDIDDANTITDVRIVSPAFDDVVLTAEQWRAMPNKRDDAPVYFYLLMPGVWGLAGSPEMGFMRNLDVYAAEGRWIALPPHVRVTGEWGWAVVPDDVKLAAVWMISNLVSNELGRDYQSESIANYSYTLGPTSLGAVEALPARAKELLASYTRVKVG